MDEALDRWFNEGGHVTGDPGAPAAPTVASVAATPLPQPRSELEQDTDVRPDEARWYNEGGHIWSYGR